MSHYDVVVVGGSYAGLAASLQLARARRKVLIIDAGLRRNRFAEASHGFLGQDGRAPGEIVEEARGYAVERVNRAQGEAARFQAILAEYRGSERVTRQRMFLETMEDILPKAQHLYIMQGGQHPALPLINLSPNGPGGQQAPSQPRTATATDSSQE